MEKQNEKLKKQNEELEKKNGESKRQLQECYESSEVFDERVESQVCRKLEEMWTQLYIEPLGETSDLNDTCMQKTETNNFFV